MSDNNDKLDDLFKNRFDEVELPVSDKLLANIKQELNAPKRKRRFGFWIWLVCGLVVVAEIINISMPYFKKEKNETANKTEMNNSNNASVNKELNDDESKKDNTNNSNSLENKNNNQQNPQEVENKEQPVKSVVSSSIEKNKETIKNSENETNKKNVETKVNKKEKIDDNKKNQPSTTMFSDVTNQQQKSLEKEKIKKTSKNAASKDVSEQVLTPEKKLSNTNINKEESLATENKSVAKNSITLNTSTSKENKTDGDSIKNNTVATVKEIGTDTLAKSTDTSAVAAKNEVDTTKAITKEEPKTETSVPKSFAFFVELNGGPSQSFRILSPENNTIVKHRNASETATLSNNASLDFGMLFKNKYQITTGIGIDTKAEKYYYKGHSAEYYTYLDSFYVYDSIFDSTLTDSLLYIDSTYTIAPDSEVVKMSADEKRIKNTYQYLKIPLMVGYRFTINERWFITPNAGVIVNYLISGNATWYDEVQHQYVSYNAKTDYRTLVFAARAKIDIGFNVKDKWSILLQPAYTRFLQSIYRKENSFKHLPYSYDLNLAVRYTF